MLDKETVLTEPQFSDDDLPVHGDVGIRLTKELMMDSPVNPQDELSRDGRALVWDVVHQIHDFMLAETGGPGYRHHHRLWGGPKGYSKTACANMDAVIYTMLGGGVYSITGLWHGFQVEKKDLYTFSQSIPHKSWMVIDEVHTYVDSHGQAARNQILAENDALLRKIGGRLDATSTRERRLPQLYKEEIDCVFYPQRYTPAHVQADYAAGRTPQWHYPPWCFVRVDSISPRPYVPKDLRHEWEIAPARERTRKWTRFIEPALMYITAHLYDSWATPELGAGMLTSAADVKGFASQSSSLEAEQMEEWITSFYIAFNKAQMEGWRVKATDNMLATTHVVGEVQRNGCTMPENRIREFLKKSGVTNANGSGCKPRALLQKFNRLNQLVE